MKFLSILILLTSGPMFSEDLLSQQAGTAVPAGTWTRLNFTGTAPDYLTYFDKWEYVPAIDRVCMLGSYREPSSEPNRSWACYSFSENRWDIWDTGSSWHNEHLPEGGHPMGEVVIDPTQSIAMGQCCFSGSQVAEGPRWGMYWYDFVGQVGIPKQTATALRQMTMLGTAAFDVFDYKLVAEGGDSGMQGTSIYDPGSNAWKLTISTSCSGKCPPASINSAAMALDTLDKKIYLFGGATTAPQNTVYRFTESASRWESLAPTCNVSQHSGKPACPSPRFNAGWAFDCNDNFFLMHGGYTIEPAGGTMTDTWIYDPVANAWTELNPATVPSEAAATFERLAYIKEEDVFVLWNNTSAETGQPAIWAFRYYPGEHSGYSSRKYSYTAGTMNRNTTSQTEVSWAYGGALASSGTTLYQAWAETNAKGEGNNRLLHPYAQEWTNNTFTKLGGSYSMSADSSGAETESFDVSLGVVRGTLWACWHEQNVNVIGNLQCKGYSDGSWSLGGRVAQVAKTGFDDGSALADVGGMPTIIFREQDRTIGILPYPTYAYVKQWNGKSFELLGKGLNNGATNADSVAIASDGTAEPYVAWTQYGTGNTNSSVTFTVSQVHLSKWNGSAWAAQCHGKPGNVSQAERAYYVSMTYMGGQPYLAFVERTDAGIPKLYVRTCSNGAWGTVGAGYLNRDQVHGWAFRPEISTDGTNLYVVWSEQGNSQPWLGELAFSSGLNQKTSCVCRRIYRRCLEMARRRAECRYGERRSDSSQHRDR